jgi:hypothetical protein
MPNTTTTWMPNLGRADVFAPLGTGASIGRVKLYRAMDVQPLSVTLKEGVT